MIRIAMIGTGTQALGQARKFNAIRSCKLVACADLNGARARAFAKTHGIPQAYDDAATLMKEEQLDGVTILTPDAHHCAPALQAIAQGLHVMCEKPLSDNLKDARRMAAAARRKGIITAVNFSYRDHPALQKAAQLVAGGKLGRIRHVEGSYLQTWLTVPVWGDWHTTEAFLWRLSIGHGSMGCLGDIGVHLYDAASFVVGDIAALQCTLQTFDKGTKTIGPYTLDANDSFVSTVQFKNGALGTLHASRWATGKKNTLALRVFGELGALDLDSERDEAPLRACLGKQAIKTQTWKPVRCPAAPNMCQRFVTAIRTGTPCQTSFADAVKIQACLEASFQSAGQNQPVRLK